MATTQTTITTIHLRQTNITWTKMDTASKKHEFKLIEIEQYSQQPCYEQT